MKNFETYSDVTADSYFIQAVKDTLSELVVARLNRPAAKRGFRYKRDWYDRMTDAHILTYDYFISNAEAIWTHKSSLNSEFRNIIQNVLYLAHEIMLKKYKEEDEQDTKQE